MQQTSQAQSEPRYGRCACGMCQAFRASAFDGGIDWWLRRVNRWWDRRNRRLIVTTSLDHKLVPDHRGLCQCPRCRELLLPDATTRPEQAQLKMEAMK